MDWPTLLTVFLLAVIASWTPGPNNAMLASSGATFGLRLTVPHILGVTLGFPAMVFAASFGLGEVVAASPLAHEVLRWLGAAVLLWFAWRIARSSDAIKLNPNARPLSFLEAAGFQWINPKAWTMCVGLSSQFAIPGRQLETALTLAGVFIVSGAGSSCAWAGLGTLIKQMLRTHRRLRIFNMIMGGLLATFVLVLFEDVFRAWGVI